MREWAVGNDVGRRVLKTANERWLICSAIFKNSDIEQPNPMREIGGICPCISLRQELWRVEESCLAY